MGSSHIAGPKYSEPGWLSDVLIVARLITDFSLGGLGLRGGGGPKSCIVAGEEGKEGLVLLCGLGHFMHPMYKIMHKHFESTLRERRDGLTRWSTLC